MRLCSRRLRNISVIAIDPAARRGSDDRLERSCFRLGAKYFPRSVRASARRGHSVVLETHVFDHERGAIDHPVVLQVAMSWRFAKLVAETDLMATPDHQFQLSVRLVRLVPDRSYYFRFIYLGVDGAAYVSPVGHIRPTHGDTGRQDDDEIVEPITGHH